MSDLIVKTLAHLIIQGRPSKDGVNCMYRGPGGVKCAVGFHIPDEMYDPNMELQGVQSIVYEAQRGKFQLPEILLDEANTQLWNALQCFHDGNEIWKSPVHFYAGMKGFMAANCIQDYQVVDAVLGLLDDGADKSMVLSTMNGLEAVVEYFWNGVDKPATA